MTSFEKTPLDRALAQLAQRPLPPALSGIEARVWEQVAAGAAPAWGWRIPASAMAVAMIAGVIAGQPPAGRDLAGDMDALSVRPALLPSTLLAAR